MLPNKVLELLRENRLAHLGTCKDNVPSVSLMNFALIEADQRFGSADGPVVVVATPENTQKYVNILANPKVSLLFHNSLRDEHPRKSLSEYLQSLNHCELTKRSVTLQGYARVAEDEEAEYYRDVLLTREPESKPFVQGAKIIVIELAGGATLADALNHVEQF
ncbi:Pyridoxamine 5'-phosphate oxidase [Wickerhamiella sorbophila]|uniref:Pyridoxamine 5'-phosphate oxidase n=1 Tax=Wickerhamiella sorbophila TaxID=45607 RepID=A0A2T0FGL3_9ASCO|nr:Pyridoxamine 5'-phosphate oxidase [Wickerhamiella sorbophila]PRT54120.1 Pyridoxamine 5'-phosphate oxidase [Wickerhamiella sorbophila]